MEKRGWIKLHRKILDNPIMTKPEYLSIFTFLCLSANHSGNRMIFNNQTIEVKPGQLITSRNSISKKLKISESKVERCLKYLKIEQVIEQASLGTGRLITILNYDYYQGSEQESEQPVNSQRTASEQPVNTNNNDKNDKNEENDKKTTKDKRLVQRKNVEPLSFQKFWEVYPRREARIKALQSWKKLNPDDNLLAVILSAIAKRKKSEQWQRNIIPLPATWLNQQRWNDEFETNWKASSLQTCKRCRGKRSDVRYRELLINGKLVAMDLCPACFELGKLKEQKRVEELQDTGNTEPPGETKRCPECQRDLDVKDFQGKEMCIECRVKQTEVVK